MIQLTTMATTVAMTAMTITGAMLVSGAAQAVENGLINYPVGAAGTNNAGFPPIPGVFVLEQLSYTSANGLYGDNGKKLALPFKNEAYVGTTRVLLSYPFELPGAGRLYSQIVLPVVGLNTTFLGQKSSTAGLSLRYDNPLGLDIAVSHRLLFNQRNDTTK